MPFGEQVFKVPVERQQKLEFGFRSMNNGDGKTEYTKDAVSDESLMLTGDLNLADVEWVVQFRINDAYKYLFKVRDPESTLRNISEAATRQIVGDRTVNEVLTIGRSEITVKIQELIQDICNEYSMGIKIEQVVLQDVNPPDPVKAAFNAVNEAQQEKETLINQAKSEYNKVIPKASGEAEATIQKAEGYSIERVNNAQGEAARFNDLYSQYVKAPEVTKKRLYLENLSQILSKAGNVLVTDQSGANVLPLLQMQFNKETLKAEKNEK
ncbi:HflK protein [Arcticibacter svalbardensis MN12-7]|uniref:Protein HflK n=2 Tax=Arcticibacter TaxID=1288026 RepID=R9GMY4_9SPHI|nr:HflK protein [Arcticibacter svalbardensis MN12-7]